MLSFSLQKAMNGLNSLADPLHNIANCFHTDYIAYTNKLGYVNNNGVLLHPSTGKVLYYITHAFPLGAALFPKIGITARAFVDLSEAYLIGDRQGQIADSLVKSVLSGVSAYCLFFAPLYFKHVEIFRSIVMNARDLYNDEHKNISEVLPNFFNLLLDAINLFLVTQEGLKLQLASHLLQCIGGCYSLCTFSNWSPFNIKVWQILTLFRAISVIAVARKMVPLRPS